MAIFRYNKLAIHKTQFFSKNFKNDKERFFSEFFHFRNDLNQNCNFYRKEHLKTFILRNILKASFLSLDHQVMLGISEITQTFCKSRGLEWHQYGIIVFNQNFPQKKALCIEGGGLAQMHRADLLLLKQIMGSCVAKHEPFIFFLGIKWESSKGLICDIGDQFFFERYRYRRHRWSGY